MERFSSLLVTMEMQIKIAMKKHQRCWEIETLRYYWWSINGKIILKSNFATSGKIEDKLKKNYSTCEQGGIIRRFIITVLEVGNKSARGR